MTIYTGRGDEGRTDLADMSRVSKTAPRIEAYGTVDEANALLGTIRPTGYDDVDDLLRGVQNELHVIQADLASPDGSSEADANDDKPRIRREHVTRLEDAIDDVGDEIEPLQSFILPSGSEVGAGLHHARAVVRRAERRTVALAGTEEINERVVAYLNRLSDLLFTLARVVNARDGDREESPTY